MRGSIAIHDARRWPTSSTTETTPSRPPRATTVTWRAATAAGSGSGLHGTCCPLGVEDAEIARVQPRMAVHPAVRLEVHGRVRLRLRQTPRVPELVFIDLRYESPGEERRYDECAFISASLRLALAGRRTRRRSRTIPTAMNERTRYSCRARRGRTRTPSRRRSRAAQGRRGEARHVAREPDDDRDQADDAPERAQRDLGGLRGLGRVALDHVHDREGRPRRGLRRRRRAMSTSRTSTSSTSWRRAGGDADTEHRDHRDWPDRSRRR